jgi:transcriptional regulator with XRE-family HTH domain
MAKEAVGSTVPRRELGRRLRRLREEAGITIADAAEELETSSPRIWRIEKGVIPMRSGEVRLMCELYGADKETTTALMALAKETKAQDWWRVYADALPQGLDLLFGLEQAALEFRWWESQLVPGVLQTERYARKVMEADSTLSPSDLELLVKARMDRQKLLLNRSDAPRLNFLIDEGVLDHPAAPDVIREQYGRLLDVSSRLPNVTLRVVPHSAGIHEGRMAGSFTILEFPQNRQGNGEPTTVYSDAWITPLYFTKPHEVDRYIKAFDALTKRSLDEQASADLIKQRRGSLL